MSEDQRNEEQKNDEQTQARLQELWELEFDCHPDPERLRAELRDDPRLQAMHDDVRRQAETLRAAAQERTAPLELPAGRRLRRRWWPRGAPGRVLGVAAALLLLWLGLLATWGLRAWQAERVGHTEVTLHVSGPRGAVAVADYGFTVEARTLEGEPRETEIEWQAWDADGAPLGPSHRTTVAGRTRLVVPASERVVGRVTVRAPRVAGAEELTLDVRGGEARPLVHVALDRPLYRPGETLRMRLLRLDRVTLEPSAEREPLAWRIVGPRGDAVQSWARARFDDRSGASGQSWAIPPSLPGGRYRVEVGRRDQPPLGDAEFVLRRYARDRLAKTVTLDRRSYAPGERGSAAVQVERLGAGPAAGAAVTATLWLDGAQVWQRDDRLDARGRAEFAFDVPRDVERGAARFVARVDDDGVVETAVEAFVVPTGELDVDLLPEGGTLVAGLENRVYVETRDPLGRSVVARGAVVDVADGSVQARFATGDSGRARVAFTPRSGHRYRLRVDAPAPAQSPDVEAVDDGVLLSSLHDLQPAGEPLGVEVAAPRRDAPLLVTAFCRGQLVGQATVAGALHTPQRVTVPLDDRVSGVLRVTVFDAARRPLAERLVRRATLRPWQVEVRPRQRTVTPGARQRVDVVARHADGRPAAGVFLGMTVTDSAPWARLGATRVGLRDAAELLADVRRPDAPEHFRHDAAGVARRADLLLGTQGWRRFVWDGDAEVRARLAELGDDYVAVAAREAPLQTPQAVDSREVVEARQRAARRQARHARQWAAAGGVLLLLALLSHLVGEGAAAFARFTGANRLGQMAAGVLVALLVPLGAAMSIGQILGAGNDARVAAGMAEEGAELRRDDAMPVESRVVEPEDLDAGAAQRVVRAAHAAEDAVLSVTRAPQDDRTRGFVADRSRFDRWTHSGDDNPAARDSFPETVAMATDLVTAADGRAWLEFDTGEQVTTWRADVDAHGGGQVGQGQAEFTTALPLHVDAMLPATVTAGDVLSVPVTVRSRDGAGVAALQVEARGALRLLGAAEQRLDLDAEGAGRLALRVEVAADVDAARAGSLRVRAGAEGFHDAVEQELTVLPRGFPHARSAAGNLTDSADLRLVIPAGAQRAQATLRLFPSALSQLGQGIEGMLQEPHGCFEQTASTSYPNTLALELLEGTAAAAPEVAARARTLLDRGYARLTSFECPSDGYEWFGADPGHAGLTAYGLLQFADLQRVHDIVDDDMLARTRGYLLARRDGEGGFRPSERALDRFGRAPEAIRGAWCTYALLHAGHPADELTAELDRLAVRARSTDDPYELALNAGALHLGGRTEDAAAARARLATLQQDDGSLQGTTTSITSSREQDLRVETTALSILAWLHGDDAVHEANAARALQWLLGARRGNGSFGATQATIQALRALSAWTRRQAGNAAGDGFVVVRDPGDGRELARRAFATTDATPVTLDLLPFATADGTPRPLELALADAPDGTALPWTLDVRYHADQPADDPEAPLAIRTLLPRSAEHGAVVTLRAIVRNLLDDEPLPMVCATIGLPAGLEARTNLLDELVDSGTIAAWETRGPELVLYWRGLPAGTTVDVPIPCVARFPGETTGAASRVWLYYAPDAQRWAPPLTLTIPE